MLDVEGEVNGLLTYDREVLRPNVAQWQADIQALYDAVAARSNGTTTPPTYDQPQQMGSPAHYGWPSRPDGHSEYTQPPSA